ncbi:MAG: Hpt domain-containing protein [Pseudomonadota bacterium]
MINWTRVTELRDEIGQEDFAEIAEVFLMELEETIQELGQEDDADARRVGFHSLKGAALNLGFETVSELSAAAEASPVDANLGAIADACRVATSALRERYPEIAA